MKERFGVARRSRGVWEERENLVDGEVRKREKKDKYTGTRGKSFNEKR